MWDDRVLLGHTSVPGLKLRSTHTPVTYTPVKGKRAPRVLLVLTEFPPRIGGMQTHAAYLSKHLMGCGYQVEVITYQPASSEEHEAERTSDADLGYPVLRVLSRLGFWHNVEKMVAIAGRFQPDLVYCSTVFYGFLHDTLKVPVICRSVGNDVLRPWIAYPFHLGSRLLSQRYLDERVYRFFRQLDYPERVEVLFRRQRWELMRRAARRINLVVANSVFTADLLREIGLQDAQIEVLVGGVDAARFRRPADFDVAVERRRAGFDPDAFLLTTACRLVAKKGIDFLLPAFARLRRDIPKAHLQIIGDGRHAKRYRSLAKTLGLERHITFTGSIDHQQIHPRYWISDLFVLASRVQHDQATGLRDAETMGRVLCEANAAGVVTLAARSGGIPSVIQDEDNGLLFEPDDADTFIRAVQRVRASKDLAKRLQQRGLKHARERFDWSIIMARHERIFESFIAARSVPR
ncbi:MAG: glycosyltransferase family 4 protein [Deltaproteobacteria bacterium]|nr:glycosyltransferase family 4 protein [Deltaproteobacteria bacterium]